MKIQPITIAVFAIGLTISCVKHVTAAPPIAQAPAHYTKLDLKQEPQIQGGFYDPSVTFSPDGKIGILVYSALLGSPQWNFPIGPYIQTHLARSTDGGQSWQYIATVNESVNGNITMPDGSRMNGVWRYEVPTLVYDAGDPGHEWKLFSHRYFWSKEKDRMPAFGWIALKTAPDPTGPWSPEVALFGSQKFPPPPYHTDVNLNALDKSLSDILVYSEPGAYVAQGIIYMSLTALRKHGPEKIVLLASHDHGKSWEFSGTLTTNDDAEALGYKSLDGSAIVEDGGKVYLLVSPEGDKAMHEGTLVIPFMDLDTAQLARDDKGRLAPSKLIPCQPGIMSKIGCGQATYDSHSVRGIIIPQADFDDKPHIFQIWQTDVRPAN